MNRIVLIGAGQLGSRHLQSLALIDRDTEVTVLDPSPEALDTARQRLEQVQVPSPRVRAVRYIQRFDDLRGEFALAVVATGADRRREAIEGTLQHACAHNMLLEKVLFQRLDDYAAVDALLASKNTRAWVNCAQRLWPFFRNLKTRLAGKRHVQILATGSQWGLGCNSIHNADLLPFYTGDAAVRFTAELDPGTIESKRAGFVEFTGTLRCEGRDGWSVTQTSWREGSGPFTFEVLADDLHQVWRVAEGKALTAEAASGWAWRESEVRAPYQSQLTHLVVQQILDTGCCDLPTYAESSALHVKLLEAFMHHLSAQGSNFDGRCPIT